MKKQIYPKLPKVFKKKWLKALRSGEFKQTGGSLENANEYCCLGVACRITHPKLKLEDKGLIRQGTFKLGSLKVPKAIMGSNCSQDKDYNPLVDKLTTMNDGPAGTKGKSFKVIANWIDKNL